MTSPTIPKQAERDAPRAKCEIRSGAACVTKTSCEIEATGDAQRWSSAAPRRGVGWNDVLGGNAMRFTTAI